MSLIENIIKNIQGLFPNKKIQIEGKHNISIKDIDNNSTVIVNLFDEAIFLKFKEEFLQENEIYFKQFIENLVKILQEKFNISQPKEQNQIIDSEQNEDYRKLIQNASFDLSKINNYFAEYKDTHIERAETTSIFNWIKDDLSKKQKNIAILKGNAGLGKTIVLKDLYELLENNDIPTLAIKADMYVASDRVELEKKIFQCGDITILEVVNSLSQNYEKIVVIIDQLDALSQTLSSQRDFLVTYNRLINELSQNSKIRIVISIRNFDLDYDAELSEYKKSEYTHFDIQPLNSDRVKGILTQIGVSNYSDKLVELLKIPNHLNIFCKLENKNNSYIGNLSSLRDLYDALWKEIVKNKKEFKIKEFLYEVAIKMNEIGEISIYNKFDDYFDELDYLKSKGIIFESNNGKDIQFFHQTFYDYVFSRQFVEKGNLITKFIIEKKQNLYTRATIKMVLEYLREYNSTLYLEQIKEIITDEKYRFHIKFLVITNIAFSTNIIKGEKSIVVNHILPNEKYAEVFIKFVVTDVWFGYLMQQDIPKKYLEKNLKIKLIAILFRNVVMNNVTNNVSKNVDLILDCLESIPNFQNNDNFIANLLYSLSNWENKRLWHYFEEYLLKPNYFFYHELEKIAIHHKEYAFEILKKIILEDFSESDGFSVSLSYDKKDFLNKINRMYPQDTFKILFSLMQEIIENNKLDYISEKIDTNLYESVYFSDNKFFSDYSEDADECIFDLLTGYLNTESQNNTKFFNQFYQQHKNSNSIPILKLLVIALTASDIYDAYFIEIIDIIHNKKGFSGYDDRFSLCLKNLIAKYYPTLNQNDKSRINNIILNMKSVGETEKIRVFGEKQYMYLKILPINEIQNNLLLKKRYQELERKFGKIEKEYLTQNKITFRGVNPPIKNNAYSKMSFDDWEKSMLKYNYEYEKNNKRTYVKGEDAFKGGIDEHSEAFKRETQANPEKYKGFVEKLISEKKVENAYLVEGMRGLVEGKYSPQSLLPLYKSLIQCDLNRFQTLCCVWMCDYFIKTKVMDLDIVEYLSNLALKHEDPSREINRNDPHFDSVNNVRGSAIQRLIWCCYNPEFKGIIFDTTEKATKDLQPSVKVAILLNLPYLNKLNKRKTFRIFKKLVKTNKSKILKHSIYAAYYCQHTFFDQMGDYFNKLIGIEPLYKETAKLFCWCLHWNEKAKDLLEILIKRSDKDKLAILEGAEDWLFEKGKLNQKYIELYERFLDIDDENFADMYSCLILRKFTLINLTQVLPFLRKYVTSKSCELNKSYFLDYLITCAKTYPKECLELIECINFGDIPDVRKAGYYHREKPLLAILAIYSTFNSKKEDDESEELENLMERSLSIFDKMLQNEFISSFAEQALDAL